MDLTVGWGQGHRSSGDVQCLGCQSKSPLLYTFQISADKGRILYEKAKKKKNPYSRKKRALSITNHFHSCTRARARVCKKCIGKDFTIEDIKRILISEYTERWFTIGMHWKVFYCRNILERFLFLLEECIRNDSTIEDIKRILISEYIERGFTIGMHWKGFYGRNTKERFYLLEECIGNDFTIGMHWKEFYFSNELERVLQ